MLLSLIAIAAVGAIAFWHYKQGFFSAALSAMMAIIAAALALGLHEFIAVKLAKFPDVSQSLLLGVLFAAIYAALRAVFDKTVPGNVAVPLMVDRVGGGVMGVIAGVFAAGVLLVAIQDLPLGPSIAGFQRYALGPPVEVPNQTRTGSMQVMDLLKDETLSPSGRAALLVPVDDMVVGAASRLSSGALSWDIRFGDIHPAYLDEAFFSTLGVQPGAKHVAINNGMDQQVSVQGLYTMPSLPLVDGEESFIPQRWSQAPPTQIKSDSGNMILIARVALGMGAADLNDHNVRMSTASVRLCSSGVNYRPIGSLDYSAGLFVRANRPDDFLFVPAGGFVDFVFQIPSDVLGIAPSDPKKPAPMTVGQGIFLEAKRLGMADLSGMDIRKTPPDSPKEELSSILRKKNLPMPKGYVPPAPVAPAGGAVARGAAPSGATGAVIENPKGEVSSLLFTKYAVSRYDDEGGEIVFPSGSATIRERKPSKLTINPGESVSKVGEGEYLIQELWAPEGNRLVLISGSPPSTSEQPWEWAQRLTQFDLVDTTGKSYKPNGAWAKVQDGATTKMIARYDAENPVGSITPIPTVGRPTDLWIAFVIPSATTVQQLRFAGAQVATVNLSVP